VELTHACLARIQKLQPLLNAYITVIGDQALAEERMRDSELQRGNWRGPIHGVPIALRDNIEHQRVFAPPAQASCFRIESPRKTPNPLFSQVGRNRLEWATEDAGLCTN